MLMSRLGIQRCVVVTRRCNNLQPSEEDGMLWEKKHMCATEATGRQQLTHAVGHYARCLVFGLMYVEPARADAISSHPMVCPCQRARNVLLCAAMMVVTIVCTHRLSFQARVGRLSTRNGMGT